MKFPAPLVRGTLIRRYKRFLSDVRLADGSVVVAHCANSGSMLSVDTPGAEVWLSRSDNPNRKLKFTWELIQIGDALVGINTSWPNALVAEAIQAGAIKELAGYDSLRREVRYGKNSRIDILLESEGKPPCYVEVKNVTLRRDTDGTGLAEFPDAVTTRGAKHLVELGDMVEKGARAVMMYLVQRPDCRSCTIAADIDPGYAEALKTARAAGVEVLCYDCQVSPKDIRISGPVPFKQSAPSGAKRKQRKR